MKILSIETSTILGGVSIIDEGGLIIECRLNVKSTHSERLMTTIDFALRQAGIDIAEIGALAVSVGPGSFTGLRIGLSAVKGISYATGIPVVSVKSLETLAWNFPFSRYPVCPIFDARKAEVYASLYRWDKDGFIQLLPETTIRPDRLIDPIDKLVKSEKIIFVGEGAVTYRKQIEDSFGQTAIFPPNHLMSAMPANAAYIGLRKAQRGEYEDPKTLSPLYIRKSEAEIKLETGQLKNTQKLDIKTAKNKEN